MYRLNPEIKQDPQRRWLLPDRVFFGHGACRILAGVYLMLWPSKGYWAERIVPGDGFSGNHIYVTNGIVTFDFHGYADRFRLLLHHTSAWAGCSDDGWHCALERVDFDLLSTSELNARKMLGPDQNFADPIARACAFIQRFDCAIDGVEPPLAF